MRPLRLERIFRQALILAALPAGSVAACGGATLDDIPDDNGAPATGSTSGSTKPVPPTRPHVEPTDAGVVVVDAARKDATTVDASVKDAAKDAVVKDVAADVPCIDLPTPPFPLDGGNTCDWRMPVPCGVAPDAGNLTPDQCNDYCGAPAYGCYVGPNSIGGGDGEESVLYCYACAIGRRPEAFTHDARIAAANDVGLFFAVAAELEAASVFSFERLERELCEHDAPESLCLRARRAADDERRHARMTSALAFRHGGAPVLPREAPMSVRDLESVALENAVEGCVRETYGALVATLQAERASDPRVRAAMRQIAVDETAHATLAWDIAGWLDDKLDHATRDRVHHAMKRAIDDLARELATDPPADVQTVAGLPSASESTALCNALRELLWAA